MKKSTKRGRPPRNQELTETFQVRCTPEQKRAYEAEAERLGFRRGPHDTGIGMLARLAMDRTVAEHPIAAAIEKAGRS